MQESNAGRLPHDVTEGLQNPVCELEVEADLKARSYSCVSREVFSVVSDSHTLCAVIEAVLQAEELV